MNAMLIAFVVALFIFVVMAILVLVLTWILSTLLPLFGITATVTWLHGLALFLLIGIFGSRVRQSK